MNVKKLRNVLIILVVILALIIWAIMALANDGNEIIEPVEREVTNEDIKNNQTKTYIDVLNIIENDFHMKYSYNAIDQNGEDVAITEEYSEKGNMKAIYNDIFLERVVVNGDKLYTIDENLKTMIETDLEPASEGLNLEFILNDPSEVAKNFVGSGQTVIDGKEYQYEEYSIPADTNRQVKYYFADDMLQLIEYEDVEENVILFDIEILENNTYDFMFNLSESDYEVIRN